MSGKRQGTAGIEHIERIRRFRATNSASMQKKS
ncbi:MAG: hypothetical protein Sylvanvirus37_5 [Sylvanvirus sp.]|uniref:Uncharacterized protein n=1 Tax=Sylvanvirus sp. TaxID=2487774 RepID=A0A3G5AJ64_9VIRU|nr:MAG: hypothetical protein Sylvanvirus37_5 [Sylvanvirus sp.]